MRQSYKTFILWVVIILMLVFFYQVVSHRNTGQKLSFSEFIRQVKERNVKEVTIQGQTFTGRLRDGTKFRTVGIIGEKINQFLIDSGVQVKYLPIEKGSFWQQFLLSWLPLLFLIGLFLFFIRQLQSGGGKAMSFGKSRAKLLTEYKNRITFKDVAGVNEAKDELQEIIDFLKDPKKFTRLGGRIPKGVLLMGPPGTGKTLLAKAVAGEAGVPFFSISGSDFVELFVGVGASRVRDLFEQGKKHAPCIIFIDEIDAVGRHRGAGLGGGHDEREQTLNQLLVEMDGFDSTEGVILIAATNRPDVLDPALLRPGRFDRRVVVPLPDIHGREEILKVHTRKTPLAEDVNLKIIAQSTPGFSGADLENLVNEAALLAARENSNRVTMSHFERAKDKVIMGRERRSMILTEEDKRRTAVHEAGHALVGKLLPNTDPVHKVTIIPRGEALGLTVSLPPGDRFDYFKDYLNDTIAMMMAGRAADELVFNYQSTGAANDISKATGLARKMVCEWGMSEKLGPIAFGRKEEQIFLGKELVRHRDYSEATAQTIDEEVYNIVVNNYQRAKKLLEDNMEILKKIADALVEREYLSGEELDILIRGEELPPQPSRDSGPPKSKPQPVEDKEELEVSSPSKDPATLPSSS